MGRALSTVNLNTCKVIPVNSYFLPLRPEFGQCGCVGVKVRKKSLKSNDYTSLSLRMLMTYPSGCNICGPKSFRFNANNQMPELNKPVALGGDNSAHSNQ